MASPEDESEMGKQHESANKSKEKEMDRLPNDLIVEIFSRLPSKSVARFCTLSKHWASTLRSPDFAKLFLSKSMTRPRLLFAVKQFDKWQFFSTPQSQNPYEKSSSHVDFHSKFSGDVSRHMCSHASGLFYFPCVQILDEEAPLIFNPITGLYVRLPHPQRHRDRLSRGFLGFDPIDKQFKVLSEIRTFGQIRLTGPLYQSILTLGTGELSWKSNKRAEYCNFFIIEGICINGIVYFLAEIHGGVSMMVCFDVRTEEFNFIKAEWFNDILENPSGFFTDRAGLSLVNYKGKLAGIYWKCADNDGKRTVKLLVWILEDAEKHKWSKDVYILPENEVLSLCAFSVAGVTSNGNIVLVMKYMCKPFYVLYFNPERNSIQSVLIQGFGADLATVEDCVGELRTEVYAYVDYVDDLSVNNAKQLKSNISQITSICPCCKEGEAGGSISNGRCRLYCKEKLRRKRKVV